MSSFEVEIEFDQKWLIDESTIPVFPMHLIKEHHVYEIFIGLGKALGSSVGEEAKVSYVHKILNSMVGNRLPMKESFRIHIRRRINAVKKKDCPNQREGFILRIVYFVSKMN